MPLECSPGMGRGGGLGGLIWYWERNKFQGTCWHPPEISPIPDVKGSKHLRRPTTPSVLFASDITADTCCSELNICEQRLGCVYKLVALAMTTEILSSHFTDHSNQFFKEIPYKTILLHRNGLLKLTFFSFLFAAANSLGYDPDLFHLIKIYLQ